MEDFYGYFFGKSEKKKKNSVFGGAEGLWWCWWHDTCTFVLSLLQQCGYRKRADGLCFQQAFNPIDEKLSTIDSLLMIITGSHLFRIGNNTYQGWGGIAIEWSSSHNYSSGKWGSQDCTFVTMSCQYQEVSGVAWKVHCPTLY